MELLSKNRKIIVDSSRYQEIVGENIVDQQGPGGGASHCIYALDVASSRTLLIRDGFYFEERKNMISYIKGKLMQVAQNFVVVDHQGMGISVFVPTSMMARLSPVGEEIFLHTYFRVGEDGMQLYGFLEDKDLEIFKQLITVSGIGPKGALGVLSALSSDDLRIAILSGDAKAIAKAPGVGIKTAQRVIIDLKKK